MVDKAQFFNVKINVDGKIHNVKVEKGLSFNSFFVESDGRLAQYKSVCADNKCSEWDTKLHIEHPAQVKMTEAEFSIFKNVADNQKENGNDIVLSKEDIQYAKGMYRDGEFTKDISKNLPDGCRAGSGMQDLQTGLDEFSYIRGAVYDDRTEQEYSVEFCENGAAPKFRKLMDKSIDGTATVHYFAEDLACLVEGYGYVDKDGKTHDISSYNSDDYVTYDKDEKHFEEIYDKDNKLLKRVITYTENKKNIREELIDGKTTIYVTYKDSKGRDVKETRDGNNKLLLKQYGDAKEIYENGVIAEKWEGNSKYLYKNGKLVSKQASLHGRYYDFNENGKLTTIIYYSNGEYKFDIQSETNKKLSDKANKYHNEFICMSPEQIAKKIKSQIDGPSFNSKTLAMVDAIPADKFVDVLKEYQKTSGIWFNKASLFTDIMNEWNIDAWDLKPRLEYAFASYISDKKESDITAKDSEIVHFLEEDFETDNIKDFVKKFEEHIMK